jgi:hypothetical protein
VRQIDTREQEQQIGTAELDAWDIVVDRPRERATLQPLIEDPEPTSIPGEDLEAVAAAIPKEKQMTRQRLCVATHSRSSVTDHDLWRR